jgi:hypothetical protein
MHAVYPMLGELVTKARSSPEMSDNRTSGFGVIPLVRYEVADRNVILLKRGAGCGGARARRVIADHAGLVREEHALTGGANIDWGSGD